MILRLWIFNEIKIHGADLTKIPPAPVIFREAEAVMLPAGARVDRESSCATVPLQALLDHTVRR